MKVTVELDPAEISELCALTGETKKGPAVRKVVTDAIMMEKRRKISDQFVSGEWSAELEDFENSRANERQGTSILRGLWQD
ncbi:MAG: hypothetical protein ACSHYF_07055 [Verrucomicrobiaceae bacterium]